jgi:Ser/Thr protein kinase RdoA (MazF antagonist)
MTTEPMTDPLLPFPLVFGFQGDVVSWTSLGGGHIHRNMLVTCTGGRYVVQRVNLRVFPDVGGLQENGRRITRHLAEKSWIVARQVATRDGRLWHTDGSGAAWRAFEYLEGTRQLSLVTGAADAFEAARIFGAFLADMQDLAPPALTVTIPRFHDLPRRVRALEGAVSLDAHRRIDTVATETRQARDLARRIERHLDPIMGSLPRRIVHNDAKMSNVRFDSASHSAVTVVDLDTVMAGTVLHDVGELVRTATTHAPEDADDAGSVDFDLDLLDAVASGYLAGTGSVLSDHEIAALHLAGPWLAVENGVRFLTDYLEGDQYFPVVHPDQNVNRCRTQLTLTALMLDDLEEIQLRFARAAPR